MILKRINQYSSLFVIGVYLLINLFFCYPFWHELKYDNSKVGARYGEVFTVEWTMDHVYKNIISGKNPFTNSKDMLYPFGIDFTSTDSGNGFFFIFLRPFLSEHQSLSVIVALSLLFSNVGMYYLLRKLKIPKMTAFFIGLCYGYMTFLMPRTGHLTYTPTYVFPWFYFFAVLFYQAKKSLIKLSALFGMACFFSLTLYLNSYYFIMLLISISLFGLYLLITKPKGVIFFIKTQWIYFIACLMMIAALLLPWLIVLYQVQLFETLPKARGWGGAIQFSSDLFGFFVPSIYSYFTHPIARWIGSHFQFASHIFEEFSYPGLVIIISYLALGYFFIKKRSQLPVLSTIKPYFFISIVFLILTLGPFLHVLGKWGLTVEEGIRIVIPLPFAVFHYIPFMANIRAPGRLIVGFIFFAYIVSAYIITYLLKNKTNLFKLIFFSSLFLIFIIDQYFKIGIADPKRLPYKAYNAIKNDPSQVTVMELPSVVRDGFVYLGDVNSLEFIEGQMIHQKPVIGGYAGRVPNYKREYYERNPFLGYVYRLIDQDIQNNGSIDRTDLDKWKAIDLPSSRDTVDFLNLKYILLDEKKIYSATISGVLTDLGFHKYFMDGAQSLWQRQPSGRDFDCVNIGEQNDDLFLGAGWNLREEGFRWAGKKPFVMFKLKNIKKLSISFIAQSFYKDQQVAIYVNYKKINEMNITADKLHTYKTSPQAFQKGINYIHFRFKSAYKPSQIIQGSQDEREISAKFTEICLNKKQ